MLCYANLAAKLAQENPTLEELASAALLYAIEHISALRSRQQQQQQLQLHRSDEQQVLPLVGRSPLAYTMLSPQVFCNFRYLCAVVLEAVKTDVKAQVRARESHLCGSQMRFGDQVGALVADKSCRS